jgi:hypothetical protein
MNPQKSKHSVEEEFQACNANNDPTWFKRLMKIFRARRRSSNPLLMQEEASESRRARIQRERKIKAQIVEKISARLKGASM